MSIFFISIASLEFLCLRKKCYRETQVTMHFVFLFFCCIATYFLKSVSNSASKPSNKIAKMALFPQVNILKEKTVFLCLYF